MPFVEKSNAKGTGEFPGYDVVHVVIKKLFCFWYCDPNIYVRNSPTERHRKPLHTPGYSLGVCDHATAHPVVQLKKEGKNETK